MSVTQTSLEALVLKATNESLPQPDEAALEAFCTVLSDHADGPVLAAQALSARMQSLNPREAMLALVMLDRCMRRCDANFHAEIGKFRFLNEMIKLVSPKYYADRTAPEVRTRVLQLLHAWSIEYPKETKFKVAYDMLKNQGVITETPPPLPPEDIPVNTRSRPKPTILEDEEKSKLLQKLLRSKNPEDLQHANKLIKTMVREEERRNENNCRRSKEIGSALDSAELLQDMLEHVYEATPEEVQLMEELYTTCTRYRPVIERMTHGNNKPAVINQVLLAGDVLEDVCDKYNARMREKKRREQLGQPSLADFSAALNGKTDTEGRRKARGILEEMGIHDQRTLSIAIVEMLKPVSPGKGKGKGNNKRCKITAATLLALSKPNKESPQPKPAPPPPPKPQPPQNLMEMNEHTLMTIAEELPSELENKSEGWDELDSLGEQLLRQALPDNVKLSERFKCFSKPVKKIPMNAFEKSSPVTDPQPSSNDPFLDLDFFTTPSDTTKPAVKPVPKPNPPVSDDAMVDISFDPPSKVKTVELIDMLDLGGSADSDTQSPDSYEDPIQSILRVSAVNDLKNIFDVKPLTDIFITLPSVQPSQVPPKTIYEEQGGLTVILHFCKNKPRHDVNVIVISTTSKSVSPIIDYKFQAVVPKSCKVRLLTPSASSLPAYNPFLPPPALTQMMLIGRPAVTPVSLKFVITYQCNDEPCSEMGEVPSLPLDLI